MDKFEGHFIDIFFSIRGELSASNDILIVDIDEKSLKELGQWPWPRHIMAQILDNLTKAEVAIIGFDIVFAEPDRTSPYRILQKFHIKNIDTKEFDYDFRFAHSIAKSPTILGYAFRFDKKVTSSNIFPNIPIVIIEKGKKVDTIPKAQGIVLNIPILQESAYSSGFFNTIPDNDGVVRNVPMLISYQDQLFPSLSLEIFRLLAGADTLIVHYDEVGVSELQIGDFTIPTDRFARMFVNYRGAGGQYRSISAVDIFKNRFKKEDIKNKIILVGTSAIGLMDIRPTPFDNAMPGVEIHANLIDNLINQEFISKKDWVEGFEVFMMILLSILFFIVLNFFSPLWMFFATLFLFVGYNSLAYYLIFNEGTLVTLFYPFLLMMGIVTFNTTVNYYFESRQKEFIKQMFAKKVSKEVVEELLKKSTPDSFEVKEKEITIFFSDIRGFTTISEKLRDPKKLIQLLNSYMIPMVNIIIKYQGTVDKFIGDAIMAYWNAPKELPNHADYAVKNAIEQINRLHILNKEFENKSWPTIKIGIGIHTGLAIVGEMGSVGRSDYTAIGDSVNLASRLEGLNKYYKTDIIISDSTYYQLKEEYALLELDTIRVKGKREPVVIYEVLGFEDKRDEKEKKMYKEALRLYKKAEFKEALTIFQQLRVEYGRYIYEIYEERCRELKKNPPKHFEGVYEFKTK